MSVVSNRVEYDASFDQICQNIAKYARMGRSTVPLSWMALPTREKAVTAAFFDGVVSHHVNVNVVCESECFGFWHIGITSANKQPHRVNGTVAIKSSSWKSATSLQPGSRL